MRREETLKERERREGDGREAGGGRGREGEWRQKEKPQAARRRRRWQRLEGDSGHVAERRREEKRGERTSSYLLST